MENLIQAVPGAQQLSEWFGSWPTFHDAEVLSIELNRTGASRVRVHAFRMTSAVDSRGFYVSDKHCLVTFFLDDITALDLANFNAQNALFGLEFRRENNEFLLTFDPSHGLEGTIKARSVKIEMTPGIPSDSQYKS
jgi:hypothetical protein